MQSLVERNPQLLDKLAGIIAKKNPGQAGEPFAINFSLDSLPLNIPLLFKGYKKYVLEIGCGWGEFTRDYASMHKDWLFVAIEKKKKRVMRSIAEQKKRNIENIYYMINDVDWFFTLLFTEKCFDYVIINFPDPWPKARHHKHRFMGRQFIDYLLSRLRSGAIIDFATDYWPYLEQVFYELEATVGLQNVFGGGVIKTSLPQRPVSYFESLKKEEGENTWFLRYQKIE